MSPTFRATVEGLLREVVQRVVYDDIDYTIDDAATLALSSGEREELTRVSKEQREKKNGRKAAGKTAEDDEDEDAGEREEHEETEGEETAMKQRDGDDTAGVEEVEDEPESEGESGAAKNDGGEEDTAEEEAEPVLLSYQQKIDQILETYEFVTKQTYIDRVGEETTGLALLESRTQGTTSSNRAVTGGTIMTEFIGFGADLCRLESHRRMHCMHVCADTAGGCQRVRL